MAPREETTLGQTTNPFRSVAADAAGRVDRFEASRRHAASSAETATGRGTSAGQSNPSGQWLENHATTLS